MEIPKEKLIYTKKGITLISLVVTIIILLILAGITINLLLADGGLFERAEQSEEEHKKGLAREKLELKLVDMQAEKLVNNRNYTEGEKDYEYLTGELFEEGYMVNGDLVTVDEWQFVIDRSIPKIIGELGKSERNDQITIELTKKVETDYTKAAITITVTSSVELNSITASGISSDDLIKEAVLTNENGQYKYSITKEILTNGTYSVIVKDINDKYNNGTIKVSEITEDMNIYTKADLVNFREKVNEGRTVTVMSDIDLNKGKYTVGTDGTVTFTDAEQWTPIANYAADTTLTFKGTFEGNNHTISGLYINTSSRDQGLFGKIGESGVVSNLILKGKINCFRAGGGISSINSGLISNCINYANLSTSDLGCGGISDNNLGIIYRCVNFGDISCGGELAGGISGRNGCYGYTGFIIECINNGNVSGSSNWVGGVSGANGTHSTSSRGFICNSYNTGNISGGTSKTGGIVGAVKFQGGNSYIYNCYNRGNTNGKTEIIGKNDSGSGDYVAQNNYGQASASVEKLNVESEINQLLKDTNLYRYNAFVLKDGLISLDWE